MENNTEKIRFYKKHPVLLAWIISIVARLGGALLLIIDSVVKWGQKDYILEIIKAFTELFTWGILIGAVLVFPVVLTIGEVICLIGEGRGRPVRGDWLFDQHVFWMGGFYELFYLGLIWNVTASDWQTQLTNASRHTPIYSGSMVTFIVLLLLAFLGYEILQSIPLRKLPPLVAVLSISAMYLGLHLMFPLLGILIMILMLFGQAPDSVIKAFTETSDWNLSLRQAPQNVMYDEHYLCTVAAGGHKKIVKPLRLGRRHGHEVIVNRQLCIANAFEQVLEERTPGFHRALRHFYDTYGFLWRD